MRFTANSFWKGILVSDYFVTFVNYVQGDRFMAKALTRGFLARRRKRLTILLEPTGGVNSARRVAMTNSGSAVKTEIDQVSPPVLSVSGLDVGPQAAEPSSNGVVVEQDHNDGTNSEISSVSSAALEVNYDTGRFIPFCKQHWDRWTDEVQRERMRSLEMSAQYPTPSNLAAMLDTELLQNKMEHVSH